MEKNNLLHLPGTETRYLLRPARAVPALKPSAVFISKMPDLLVGAVTVDTDIAVDSISKEVLCLFFIIIIIIITIFLSGLPRVCSCNWNLCLFDEMCE
jgi:hypothetical protein